MKRRPFLLSAIGLVMLISLLWFVIKSDPQVGLEGSDSKWPKEKNGKMVEWEDDDGNPIMIPESELPEEIREERRQREERREKFDAIWRTPIVFYGRVVDQEGQPVEKARIDYSITDTSLEGTTMRKTFSGPDGTFEISGVRGHNLIVSVSKEGYWQFKDSRRGFFYGGLGGSRGVHQPNPENPEVFRLQRKGKTVPLITHNRQVQVPVDGGRIVVDLYRLEPNRGEMTESIEISFHRSGQKNELGHTLWLYRIKPLSGGIQERIGEFNFIAPKEGYQEQIEETVPSGRILEKRYFVAFTNGNYGSLRISVGGGSDTMFLSSSLNPDGERNLEYDSTKKIKVRTHRDGSVSLIYPEGHERKKP